MVARSATDVATSTGTGIPADYCRRLAVFGLCKSYCERLQVRLCNEPINKKDQHSERGVQKEEKRDERTKEKEKERDQRERTYLVYHRRNQRKKRIDIRADPPHPHSRVPEKIPTRKKTNISPEETEDLIEGERERTEREEVEEEEEVKEEEENLKDISLQMEETSIGLEEERYPQKLDSSSGGEGSWSTRIIEPSTLLSPWQTLERETLNAGEGEEGVASGDPRDSGPEYPGVRRDTRLGSMDEMSGPDLTGPFIAQGKSQTGHN